MGFFSKILGTHSQRELKRISRPADRRRCPSSGTYCGNEDRRRKDAGRPAASVSECS